MTPQQPLLHLLAQAQDNFRAVRLGHPVRTFAAAAQRMGDDARDAAFMLMTKICAAHSRCILERDLVLRMAQHHRSFVRDLRGMELSTLSRHSTVNAAIDYLFARYAMPGFFHSLWTMPNTHAGFEDVLVRLGRGEAVRRVLDFVPLTKRAAHLLMNDRDELSLVAAVRRAQIKALGGPEWLERDLAKTTLGKSFLDDEDFVLRILTWLCVRVGSGESVVDLVRYILWRRENDTDFALRGRTLRSLRRDVDAFASRCVSPALLAKEEPLQNAMPKCGVVVAGTQWSLVPILSPTELVLEGIRMGHCIYDYLPEGQLGESRIFSLRRQREDTERAQATVEIEGQTIIEVRGRHNRPPTAEEHQVLLALATRFDLEIELM